MTVVFRPRCSSRRNRSVRHAAKSGLGIWCCVAVLLCGAASADEMHPITVIDSEDGLVLLDTFDRLDGGFTLAEQPGSNTPHRGRLSDGVEPIPTPSGRGLSFSGDAHVAYTEPTMIDLTEGSLAIDVAMDVDFEDENLPPIIVLWNLFGNDRNSPYMARLYIITKRRTLVFGVYDRRERVWLTILKAPIQWEPGEFHRVVVTWRDKTSLFVDGELRTVGVSDGLLTEALAYPPMDLRGATLFLGPRSLKGSGFTIDRLAVYRQQIRFNPDLLTLPRR